MTRKEWAATFTLIYGSSLHAHKEINLDRWAFLEKMNKELGLPAKLGDGNREWPDALDVLAEEIHGKDWNDVIAEEVSR